VPRLARAPIRGNYFCEAIGISIAVGMVLGASTLPFYSQSEIQLRKFANNRNCEASCFLLQASDAKVARAGLDDWVLGPSQKKSPNSEGLGGAELRSSTREQTVYYAQVAQVIDTKFNSISKSFAGISQDRSVYPA